MRYDAVIFDVDGVLADTTEDFEWMDQVYRQEFPEPEKSGYENWETYLKVYGKTFRALSAENGEETLEELGLTGEMVCEAYNLVQDRKNSIMDDFSAYPHARNILQRLEGDVKLAAVSNARDDNTRYFLEKWNLIHYFDFVEGLDLEDFQQFRHQKKPNATMLEEAMEDLSVEPENVLMVGDSTTDKGAAEKAGTDFVMVDRGIDTGRIAENMVDGLDELEEFVR